VCGDRDWHDAELLYNVLDDFNLELLYNVLDDFNLDCIIEGEARGADSMSREYAITRELSWIPYPARWTSLGKAAGAIRNREMLKEDPDIVIAFHDFISNSKGTKDMVSISLKKGKDVFIVTHFSIEKL